MFNREGTRRKANCFAQAPGGRPGMRYCHFSGDLQPKIVKSRAQGVAAFAMGIA